MVSKKRRPGYTLLEVTLAIAIGVLVVAALYIALDVQFRYMQSGRDAVADGQLARGLLARLASDIRLSLGQVSPTSSTSSTSTSSSSDESESNPAGTGQFNLGIIGDESQMTLFLSTVPRYGRAETDMPTGVSDLRRITYYLVPGEGLARQEVRLVTGDETTAEVPPDILAEEVINLRFRYFDISMNNWVLTWDGSTSGPPPAVEVTMSIQPPVQNPRLSPRSRPAAQYRMVVAIPAASFPEEAASGLGGGAP